VGADDLTTAVVEVEWTCAQSKAEGSAVWNGITDEDSALLELQLAEVFELGGEAQDQVAERALEGNEGQQSTAYGNKRDVASVQMMDAALAPHYNTPRWLHLETTESCLYSPTITSSKHAPLL